jgi:hypothetical protein
MDTRQKVRESPQWREFDAETGEFITHKKIQEGAKLARFKPTVLLHENSFMVKTLNLLDKQRHKWLGIGAIRELYHVSYIPEHKPVNSFKPLMSLLYLLGFVDRKTEGGHILLYRLKPSIKPSNSRAMHELAVLVKRREKMALP